jgi:heme-degrading monooxygenase HmoA
MYAVIGRFAFRAAPDAALRARVEAEIIDPLSTLPGFKTLYFIRVSDTDTTVVHLWESRDDAERGLQLLVPRTRQLAEEGLVSGVERSMGEVEMQR